MTHEARCSARGQSLLPSICQYSAVCQSLAPPQSREEQFTPTAKGGLFCCENRTQELPGPQVNKKEWDEFLRVCFIRKNKTLGSIFRQKYVLLMLEKNYKTLQAVLASLQNNGETAWNTAMDLGDQGMGIKDDEKEMDDEDMEMDEGEGDGGETSEFKDKVMNVLKEGDFEEKISSKISQQEFLYLLALFNKSGIHFT